MMKNDRLMSYLPLNRVKGTTPERLQVARQKGIEFVNRIVLPATEDKLKPATIRRALVQTTGSRRIPLEVTNFDDTKISCSHDLDLERNVHAGYSINVHTDWRGVVSQGAVSKLATTALDYFTEITNPKIFQRHLILLKTGAITRSAKKNQDFIKKLDAPDFGENLGKFLDGMSKEDEINWLQMIKLGFIKEENQNAFRPMLNKVMKKHFSTTLVYKDNSEALSANREIVTKRLADAIDFERNNRGIEVSLET